MKTSIFKMSKKKKESLNCKPPPPSAVCQVIVYFSHLTEAHKPNNKEKVQGKRKEVQINLVAIDLRIVQHLFVMLSSLAFCQEMVHFWFF